MLSLTLYNATRTPVQEKLFTDLLPIAARVLKNEARTPAGRKWELELTLIGNTRMTQLNTHYHNKNRPTDVISLSYFDPEVPDPLVGEIFISLPYARVQAQKIGQSVDEELRFLFVHGLLHVFGYDHMKSDEEAEMLTLTYKILGRTDPAVRPA
ncbi:rRNA maturation RNase YbeY [Candidatus Peregrinibacteria bacterium CG_4_9_14_0_2_um_filter_53_11]|nr:MAG: rRNA maturation RNase YbeY [Candidatus Peregrinibacteria bacterium CG_4_9_14_0_2_um_filter_53_11]